MIYDFLVTILSPFGFEIATFSEISAHFFSVNAWYQVFDLKYFVPWLFYMAFAYGMLYVAFILPFRYFKRLIKAPDKKGKR